MTKQANSRIAAGTVKAIETLTFAIKQGKAASATSTVRNGRQYLFIKIDERVELHWWCLKTGEGSFVELTEYHYDLWVILAEAQAA